MGVGVPSTPLPIATESAPANPDSSELSMASAVSTPQVRFNKNSTLLSGKISTLWFPFVDKRLVPTAPLMARFRLRTAIVKPT